MGSVTLLFSRALYVAMNLHQFHNSYHRAIHAFFMYIAGLVGPPFIVSGFSPEYRDNLIPGIFLIGFLFYYLIKFYPNRNIVLKSEKTAFVTIPTFFLLLGLVFAWLGES